MKWLWIILLATATLAGETNQPATDEELGDKLTQAILLARVGLYAEAERLCNEILEQKPDQPTVKQLLREIDERQRKQEAINPGYALRRKLEQLIIPEVNFRQAAPADVVEFLREQTKQLSPDKTPVNMVWLVPADTKLSPITLSLRKVPFTDVLGYVTQLTGLRYRIEAHAVVIYKPEPAKSSPPGSDPNAKSP
jgi:hypothetical protein